MDHVAALEAVNNELATYGKPPIDLTEEQSQKAFASLRAYAAGTGRSLEVAVKDVVRHEIQKQVIKEGIR